MRLLLIDISGWLTLLTLVLCNVSIFLCFLKVTGVRSYREFVGLDSTPTLPSLKRSFQNGTMADPAARRYYRIYWLTARLAVPLALATIVLMLSRW